MKYRFRKVKNPQKKDDQGKWYGAPVSTNRMNSHEVCRSVTHNTTIAPAELETCFNLVCDGVPDLLKQGNSVQLGNLGYLRLSQGSLGVENIEDFNTSMIKDIRVIFTPSKELMNAIKDGLTFENAGVTANGFTFASVQDYKNYEVTKREEGGGSSGGGDRPEIE